MVKGNKSPGPETVVFVAQVPDELVTMVSVFDYRGTLPVDVRARPG